MSDKAILALLEASASAVPQTSSNIRPYLILGKTSTSAGHEKDIHPLQGAFPKTTPWFSNSWIMTRKAKPNSTDAWEQIQSFIAAHHEGSVQHEA